MQNAIIPIGYHSINRHTEQAAKLFAAYLKPDGIKVHVMHVKEVSDSWKLSHNSDTIAFGNPALFGKASAKFKELMEEPGAFWYKQLWKNKRAAALTVSSTLCGHKLNTL